MADLLPQVQEQLPIALTTFDPGALKSGLVVVDIVNGFATVGAGALAPPAPDPRIEAMIHHADRLGQVFLAQNCPVLLFQDSHPPGQSEPPYPPHCERGSGEDELVPALKWMGEHRDVSIIHKDCINGFIGAIDPQTGANHLCDWVKTHGLQAVLVLGICTDICVMDFVLTMLSARNHGLLGGLQQVAVYEPGCATYDLPLSLATQLGLPATAAHPQALTHHAGLYFMASRGADLINEVRE